MRTLSKNIEFSSTTLSQVVRATRAPPGSLAFRGHSRSLGRLGGAREVAVWHFANLPGPLLHLDARPGVYQRYPGSPKRSRAACGARLTIAMDAPPFRDSSRCCSASPATCFLRTFLYDSIPVFLCIPFPSFHIPFAFVIPHSFVLCSLIPIDARFPLSACLFGFASRPCATPLCHL